MKNIVLAAGYATRLYPLTINIPKPLLKIGNSTILDRLIKDLDKIDIIDEHIIVTNSRFIQHFLNWKLNSNYCKPITIIDDGSTENENRLGAVRDIILVIQSCHLKDDILVIAADNILDFSLSGFIDEFKLKKTSMIMCHFESETTALQRTGVVSIDENNKVLQMQEKPEFPVSNWAVPPFYIYTKENISKIIECLNEGCAFDAPGNLLIYMLNKATFHVWKMIGTRIDVGNSVIYNQINNFSIK